MGFSLYLAELRLTNFRKFGKGVNGEPGLVLNLNKGLNVLIGENDSGKTCIIDAIRFVLLTQSREYLRIDKDDFHNGAKELRIECIFRGFSINQAKDFLEWLGIDQNKQFYLRVFLNARLDEKGKVYVDDVRAGTDEEGQVLYSRARDLLRTIYLKPLRDAEHELVARRNSRLSQILSAHPEFDNGDEHHLVDIFQKANEKLKDYFKGENGSESIVLERINNYLNRFSDVRDPLKSEIAITHESLKSILEKIDLVLDCTKPGLGALNLLYIAAELLLLQIDKNIGLNLALIEELEAHLHPQAQLRLIEYLQEVCSEGKSELQVLLTTHSVTLASSVKLDNLIIFTEEKAFSLAKGNTYLHDGDYQFLERFLDSTKANLFFARGVLIVEGDAENLLLPAFAEVLGKKLSKHGVSIVNVGSTAFLRYARIFMRKKEPKMTIPVAIITDCDLRIYNKEGKRIVIENQLIVEAKRKIEEKKEKYSRDNVQAFVSPLWTLEFDIACSCLKVEFYAAILMAKDYKKADEKLNEGKEPTPTKKIAEYLEEAKIAISEWAEDELEIAKKITEEVVIKSTLSKAIVAQCFAEILLSKNFPEKKIQEIRRDPKLEYLVKAIDYVTGG